MVGLLTYPRPRGRRASSLARLAGTFRSIDDLEGSTVPVLAGISASRPRATGGDDADTASSVTAGDPRGRGQQPWAPTSTHGNEGLVRCAADELHTLRGSSVSRLPQPRRTPFNDAGSVSVHSSGASRSPGSSSTASESTMILGEVGESPAKTTALLHTHSRKFDGTTPVARSELAAALRRRRPLEYMLEDFRSSHDGRWPQPFS